MLTVYFLETQYEYNGWNRVFLELVDYLREKYGAKIVHQKGGHLNIEKFQHKLPDCEIIIHDEEKDILKAITWGEWKGRLFDIFNERANKEDILMMTQFCSWFPRNIDRSQFPFKLKGTTFYTIREAGDHSYFYEKRKNMKYEEMIDKMFMLFTSHRPDPFVLREMGICSEAMGSLWYEPYLEEAIKYRIGLSISSLAEITYREIEYMAIGLPNMRLEYATDLDPPLIPNYHYICVERDGIPYDCHLDRHGGPKYVEAYKKRFFEVKDDYKFLEFISNNAREYYMKYCSPQNRLGHVLKSLEL